MNVCVCVGVGLRERKRECKCILVEFFILHFFVLECSYPFVSTGLLSVYEHLVKIFFLTHLFLSLSLFTSVYECAYLSTCFVQTKFTMWKNIIISSNKMIQLLALYKNKNKTFFDCKTKRRIHLIFHFQ